MRDLKKFIPRKRPTNVVLKGRYVDLLSINWDEHGEDLARHITGPDNDDLWTYIPIGPFPDLSAMQGVMSYVATQKDWETLAIISKAAGDVVGSASYMRQRPEYGSVEVGCVLFSKTLQKTREATEAMFLMASHIFDDLGYRRYEWKCDNDNAASKRAAERLGFSYEGLFRQDLVVKGRNRDTAWFAMIDSDWPTIRCGFERWLAPDNFDAEGRQIRTLEACRL